MADQTRKSGSEFLTHKSETLQARDGLPPLLDVLIIDDDELDGDRMLGTLRVMCGYDASLRRAATLTSALSLVTAMRPDIIFLDDILKPSDDARQTIPCLRRAGYDGPIVVVSGQATRVRRQALLAIGATDVIHKDDVNSVRLFEAVQRAFAPPSGA